MQHRGCAGRIPAGARFSAPQVLKIPDQIMLLVKSFGIAWGRLLLFN
jgi:hypothetical protein